MLVAASAALAVLVGLAGLMGQVLGIVYLRSVCPGFVSIKVNTCICFVLVGLSLWMQRSKLAEPAGIFRRAAQVMGGLAALVGGLSLSEILFGWDLGIDQWLHTENAQEAFGSVRPGLMSPISGAVFLLLGLALMMLDWTLPKRKLGPSELLAFPAGLLAVFSMFDLVLAGRSLHTYMAPQTALTACVLSMAVLCVRPERGLGLLIARPGSGETVLGRLLDTTSQGPWRRHWLLRYLLSVAAVAVALALSELLREKFEITPTLFLFYPAVVLAAVLAGLGPSLLATFLSAGCAGYFLMEPRHQFHVAALSDVISLTIFVFVGGCISVLTESAEMTRRHALEQLRRNEVELNRAQRVARLGSWTLDSQTGKVRWSEELYRMLGLDPSMPAVAYAEQNRIFTPASWALLTAELEKTVSTGVPYELELETVRGDGSRGWMLARGEPMRDPDGNVTGLCGIALDITERKRPEQLLRESEERYRTLFESIDQGFCTIEVLFDENRKAVDFRFLEVNPAFEKQTGIQNAPGRAIREIAPQHEEYWFEAYGKVALTGEPMRFEDLAAQFQRWYDVYAFRVGEPPERKVAILFNDITKRKQAEEKLRIASLYTRSLLEASLDPLVTISRDGKITDVNEATEQVTGVSRDRLIGSDFSNYFTEPEEARQGYEQVFKQGSVRDYPLVIRHASGKLTHVLYNANVFRNEAGEVDGVFAAARDITEKKRAQETVIAEREKFNHILDVLPPYVVLLNPDYHVAFANREFRRRFGESGGRRCFEFLFGRNEPCEICETFKVLEAKKPLEWKWIGPDGRHYDIYDFPFTDTDGASLILEMGIDVTERNRAEAALQESETKFRTLSELVPQMVWACTPDGLNIYFNQRWVEYTGLSLEESYGRGWNTPFHPEDKQRAWDAWNHAVASGETYRVESRLRAADGSYRWFLIRGEPMRAGAGQIVKWFGTCTDINDLKRAHVDLRTMNQELDERVQQRTAQLEESEQRVRRKLSTILSPEGDLGHLELADLLDIPGVQSLAENFYELARIPMFIVDLQGNPLVGVGWQDICTKFHRAHPEACKNCKESDQKLSAGVAPGAFKLYKCKNNLWDVVTPLIVGGQQVGNLFSGQFFFADETVDRELFRSQAQQYAFDEQDYLAALDRVPRLSRAEVETCMTFYVKLAQLLSQLSYSGIKLARSMAELNRTNSDLAASVQELEAFTYSVSHDLRAPLRHISGFSNLLVEEHGSNLPPEALHHLQRIEEGTRRMGLLVDDLLNLARIGRRDLSLQVSGLKSVVEESVAELAQECEGRQIQWKIGDLPFVECDRGLMKQVFQNLLSNALKFTRPRAQAVIEVGQKDENGTSVVFVRDNGVGFSMKYADKLFGVFQRLHRAEDFEGTGVGLATVQRIIHKHRGRIWAEAELDKGATFYFTLGASEASALTTQAAIVGDPS